MSADPRNTPPDSNAPSASDEGTDAELQSAEHAVYTFYLNNKFTMQTAAAECLENLAKALQDRKIRLQEAEKLKARAKHIRRDYEIPFLLAQIIQQDFDKCAPEWFKVHSLSPERILEAFSCRCELERTRQDVSFENMAVSFENIHDYLSELYSLGYIEPANAAPTGDLIEFDESADAAHPDEIVRYVEHETAPYPEETDAWKLGKIYVQGFAIDRECFMEELKRLRHYRYHLEDIAQEISDDLGRIRWDTHYRNWSQGWTKLFAGELDPREFIVFTIFGTALFVALALPVFFISPQPSMVATTAILALAAAIASSVLVACCNHPRKNQVVKHLSNFMVSRFSVRSRRVQAICDLLQGDSNCPECARWSTSKDAYWAATWASSGAPGL